MLYTTIASIWYYLQIFIQIGILAILIYLILVFLKGTKAAPVLLGLTVIFMLTWLLSQLLELSVIAWLLSQVPTLLAIGILIIFQQEIRHAFAAIGSNPQRFFRRHHQDNTELINSLIEASQRLSAQKHGALIAIEQDIGLRTITENAVEIGAKVSVELLCSIFFPNTPLHDGGVVIKDSVILAASCYFPLTDHYLNDNLGSRHRAAIGLTEESDAVVIIVSEESGHIALSHKGRLVQQIDKQRLRRHLNNCLLKKKRRKTGMAV